MKRIKANNNNLFARQIDFNGEIEFYLNGKTIPALKGDTILSALLATGINSAGTHLGYELALDEYLNLPISLLKQDESEDFCAPIDKMPAVNGNKYLIKGAKKGFSLADFLPKFGKKTKSSLNIDFDNNFDLDCQPPLNKNNKIEQIEIELLIVGGGIAGLSAAKYAAFLGKNLLLLEKNPWLGGDAILFGNQAGEEKPQNIIEQAIKALKKSKTAQIKTNCEVIALNDNIALARHIYIHKGQIFQKFLRIKAKKIVLATGCDDRLPLFFGNRLRKSLPLNSAFRLLFAYGLIPNDGTIIIGNNNIIYNYALLAGNAGAKIEKIIDNRIEPKSRFIEFAKSYGIKFEPGLLPLELASAKNSDNLELKLGLAWQERTNKIISQSADNIILSGGWLANLSLWHQAGGEIEPLNKPFGLRARGEVKNIVLAGSNTGWQNNLAIIQSAKEAINSLFRKKTAIIVEKQIDELFESPIGELPISNHKELQGGVRYFDYGNSLICENFAKTKKLFAVKNNKRGFLLNKRAFSLGDVSSLIIDRKLPLAQFEQAIKERIVTMPFLCSDIFVQADKGAKKEKNLPLIPGFLQGRFGEICELWEIKSLEGVAYEIGQLIFANSDIHDPEQALGIIVDAKEGRNIALINKEKANLGQQISLFSQGGHSPALLIKRMIKAKL